MLTYLEALVSLSEKSTMGKAALALHVSQSAVSKRIAELERQLDRSLIERRGRKVILTSEGHRLVEGVRPLLTELRNILHTPAAEISGHVSVEVSVSVLISWGAKALSKVSAKIPEITLELNANHASVAIERVRSGESMIAIVQGQSTIAPDLSFLPLYNEELAIVPSGLKRFKFPSRGKLGVIAIEPHTEAWKFTERQLKEAGKCWGFSLEVQSELQSFSAITQVARAGFGHGLVPIEVAAALGIPKRALMELPKPGLSIPISLIGRRSTLGSPLISRLYNELRKHCQN